MSALDARVPQRPAWPNAGRDAVAELRLIGPWDQRRKLHVIVVGSGLAGASAAATLGELGYRVTCLCFQDRRAGRTASPPKAASTPRRTTRTTATASSACSPTP